MKGLTPIIDGEFHKRVIVDDSFWTLEDGEFGKIFCIFVDRFLFLNE